MLILRENSRGLACTGAPSCLPIHSSLSLAANEHRARPQIMTSDCTNFENWWARPIEDLCADEHNGFAVLALSFPILERYLREKSGVSEGDLDAAFYVALQAVVPELADARRAREFWHAYRNGLLHQATFSRETKSGKTVPLAWIKPSQAEVVSFDPAEQCFSVNAAIFSARVLSVIRADFSTFVGASSVNHPMPWVDNARHGEPPGSRTGTR